VSDRYSSVSGNKKVLKTFIETPSGGADGGKPVALDPATGKVHPAFVPDMSAPIQSVVASETIANRRFVNFHNSTGRKCRLSLGTYDRRVSGFVAAGGASGASMDVQTAGEITLDIGSTGVGDADIGLGMFADPSTNGLATKTAPTTTGQARQYLGHIVAVTTGSGTFILLLAIEETEELV
jgi:hypothetical protein